MYTMYIHVQNTVSVYRCGLSRRTICAKQTMILIGWNDRQGEGTMAHNSLQVA